MTSVSIIRQFYASPRTLIILLPLLEGITDETLPPKSDGFYLRLGKIKLCRCQCIWQGFRTITSFADIWRLHWKVASAIVMNVVFWSMNPDQMQKNRKQIGTTFSEARHMKLKILVMVYLCCPRDIIKSGNDMRVLDMYYASGNYEAFARPRKPEGVESKSAYIIGTGLAALTAACYLVRDG